VENIFPAALKNDETPELKEFHGPKPPGEGADELESGDVKLLPEDSVVVGSVSDDPPSLK